MFDEGFDKEVLMERKYRALRTIAVIFRILGWVTLIVGILGACLTSGILVFAPSLIFGPGQQGGSEMTILIIAAVVVFIALVVSVGLYALILIAASEGIYVFLDIEENTRKMAMQLGRMGGPAGPSPPA